MSRSPQSLLCLEAKYMVDHLQRRKTGDEAVIDLITWLVREIPAERAWTAEELDALPPYSIVGVNAGPVGHEWQPKYEVWRHEGNGQWLHLDPADRDDGETLEPSRLLVHQSTRHGQCEARIIAMHIPEQQAARVLAQLRNEHFAYRGAGDLDVCGNPHCRDGFDNPNLWPCPITRSIDAATERDRA